MKAIWGFILATLAAAIGGLITIAFQDSIAGLFNNDRLIARIEAAPWFPMPLTKGDTDAYWEKLGLGPYEIHRLKEGDNLHFAKISVRNPGSKVVDQIKILVGAHPPQHVVLFEEGEKPERFAEPSAIPLKPLAPGSGATIYVWAIYDMESMFYFRNWETYSSEGSMVLKYLVKAEKGEENFVYYFLDNWMPYIVFMMFVALAGLCLFGIVYYFSYIQQIFEDENRYLEEKIRYDLDPKKFTPKLKET